MTRGTPSHHGGPDWIDPAILTNARQLRTEQTAPEELLWNCLRGRKIGGLKFRRQHAFGPYVLDFYCAEARVDVELDGSSHESKSPADRQRDDWLRSQGITVLRFRNAYLKEGLERVLRVILGRARANLGCGAPSPGPSGHPLPGGEG